MEAVRSTCMAIPETLVLKNLGIDAPLTGSQGLVICLAIAWFWLRGGLRRPNRFEAAGVGAGPGQLSDGLLLPGIHGLRAHAGRRVVQRDSRTRSDPVRGGLVGSRSESPIPPSQSLNRLALDISEFDCRGQSCPAAFWCSTFPAPRACSWTRHRR